MATAGRLGQAKYVVREYGVADEMLLLGALCGGERGRYQLRSRSPTSSTENYALKLSLGFAVQPSAENDSYYFIKVLPREPARVRTDAG